MAVADDVLSIDAIKEEFALPENDDSLESLFVRQRKAAFDLISARTGRAILDENMRVQMNCPDTLEGHVSTLITLPAAPAPSAAKWIAADGTTTAIEHPEKIILGTRCVDKYGHGCYTVRYDAPNGLWPNWAAGRTTLELVLTVGMAFVPAPLVQAAILAMRSWFVGEPNTPPQFEAILAPFTVSKGKSADS